MPWPTRVELERRLHALLADHLDEIERRNPEGFDLGVQVFISEILVPVESTRLLREDARYTQTRWRAWSSDSGGITAGALVREVHEFFEEGRLSQEYDVDDEEDAEEEEGPDEGEVEEE